MKPSQYQLDESLGYLAGRFTRLILKRNVESFAINGIKLSSEQWIVLVHLWTEDGISQQEISRLTHKNKSHTTRLVKELEKKELLYRSAGNLDGREKIVFLTEEGKETMKVATDFVQKVLATAYTGISTEDLATCRAVLNKAFNNLQ